MSTIKRRLSLLVMSLVMTLVVSSGLLGLTGAHAHAQEPAAESADKSGEAGEVAQMPVGDAHQFQAVADTKSMTLDGRISRDIGLMGAVATNGVANAERSGAVQKFFGEAFGSQAFSGEATTDDIWALNAGLMIGMLPYAAKYQPESYKASVDWLAQHTEFTAKLDETVSEKFHKIVADVEAGETPNFKAVQDLFDATFVQLHADSDSRIHGYLAAGVWASLAYIDRTEGIGSYSVLLNGQTLDFLFRKDAKEGGVDRKIAAAITKIVTELEKGGEADTGAIIAGISQMRTAK